MFHTKADPVPQSHLSAMGFAPSFSVVTFTFQSLWIFCLDQISRFTFVTISVLNTNTPVPLIEMAQRDTLLIFAKVLSVCSDDDGDNDVSMRVEEQYVIYNMSHDY